MLESYKRSNLYNLKVMKTQTFFRPRWFNKNKNIKPIDLSKSQINQKK